MIKIRYVGFVILFVAIAFLLLSNSNVKRGFADDKESVNSIVKPNNGRDNYKNTLERTITIGDDKNYPPYSYIDKNGNPTGFNIEIAKAAAEAMGFKVNIKLGNWSDIMHELENGKIDAIAGMFYSEERAKTYSFTTRYTIDKGDVFTRNNINISSINDLKGKTVVIEADEIVGEYLKKQNLGINFVEVPTADELFKLIASNKYDYAAVTNITAYYLIKKEKYTNIKSIGLEINPNDYCMAVKKGNNDLLFTLNGGLQIIKATGKFDQIYNKWLGVYEEKSFYEKLMDYLWIMIIIAIAIILLVLWSLILKIQVKLQTRELLKTNEALSQSQQELLKSNEEMEAAFEELTATEEELRNQYDRLVDSENKLLKSEERNRAIVNAIPDIIFIIDEKGVFKDCQTRDESMLIMPKSELLGKSLWKVFPKDLAEITYEKIKSTLTNDSLESFHYDLDKKKGKKYCELRVMKCRDNEVIVISRDITLRHIAEKALEDEKNLLKTTLLSVGDGVIVTDVNGDIVIFNKEAEIITGWMEEEAKLMNFEDVFNIVDEDMNNKRSNPVREALKNMTSYKLFEYKVLTTKEKREKIIYYDISLVKDNDGNIRGTVLVFRDVTAERKNQKKIEFLSYHDQLTGLYNRRYFEKELIRLDNKENLPLTIFMADVNGLKLINDSFGHATGDELLKKVASVMLNVCGDKGIVSRIGGDEFVILLPKTDEYGADKIINNITELALKEQVAYINISISIGFQTKYHEDEDIFDVLKKAEDFMYKKKLFESPSMRGKTIGAIINTLHEKNKREEAHSHRVARYCYLLGKAMNLPDADIQELKTVGLLHDIGKVAIDENILNKPGKLTDEEWEHLKRHPEIGYRILSSVNDMAEISEYVLAHHERWDGKGYPRGLKETEIPIKSRIISIADAYDAMTSERAYRGALSKEIATEELIKNAGIQFDPEIVEIFVKKVLAAV